jgi:dienelactone hydrolase
MYVTLSEREEQTMKNYIYIIIVLIFATAFLGCAADDAGNDGGEGSETLGEMMSEGSSFFGEVNEVTFTSDDGWEIYGSYYVSGAEHAPCVLLLHMMPADRHSYDDFAPKLAGAGYDVLSIDLRGHGESLYKHGDKRSFEDFSDVEHQESVGDIEAARAFLAENGADTTRMAIVGASIGANLALVYAAQNEGVKTVVLLSPGLDYRGVLAGPAMEVHGERPALVVASDEDEYSAESCRELKDIAGESAELKIYEDSGHGTDIFESQPQLETEVISWIGAHI